MSTIERYKEITGFFPEMRKCFFAFGDKQFEEGKASAGIQPGEKIYSYGAGLFGTREGVEEYFAGIDASRARIQQECNPQEVYDYEYTNHECGFSHEDTDAIRLVISYFGEQVARTVKRHNAWKSIDDLFNPQN